MSIATGITEKSYLQVHKNDYGYKYKLYLKRSKYNLTYTFTNEELEKSQT